MGLGIQRLSLDVGGEASHAQGLGLGLKAKTLRV